MHICFAFLFLFLLLLLTSSLSPSCMFVAYIALGSDLNLRSVVADVEGSFAPTSGRAGASFSTCARTPVGVIYRYAPKSVDGCTSTCIACMSTSNSSYAYSILLLQLDGSSILPINPIAMFCIRGFYLCQNDMFEEIGETYDLITDVFFLLHNVLVRLKNRFIFLNLFWKIFVSGIYSTHFYELEKIVIILFVIHYCYILLPN